MDEQFDPHLIKNLKEIYTLSIEVLDKSPEENMCSDELNEVLSNLQNLKESFYLIEEYLEQDIKEGSNKKIKRYFNNDDFAYSLFKYLDKNGYIDGDDYDRQLILDAVYNLHSKELLEDLEWNDETKEFFVYLGFPTTEMCKVFSEHILTIEEYIDLVNKYGGNLKSAATLEELSDILDREQIINDSWPALWNYPIEEKEHCINERIPVVLVEDGDEKRYFEVPEKSFADILDKISDDREMERIQEKFVNTLVAVPDYYLPKDFSKAVQLLNRPYIPLSSRNIKYIEEITKANNTDFLKDEKGNIYTWGKADGRMQLMPIQEKYYDFVYNRQTNHKKSFEQLITNAQEKQKRNGFIDNNRNRIVDATYVSVWDDGICIETGCKVNLHTGEIFDIEISTNYTEELDILEKEFVRFLDGREIEAIVSNRTGKYYLAENHMENNVLYIGNLGITR